jgi:hypothetical protein
MTTEGSGSSSIKITTSAKGVANVEVKVYDPDPGQVYDTPESYGQHLLMLNSFATDMRRDAIEKLHRDGVQVAGDPVE